MREQHVLFPGWISAKSASIGSEFYGREASYAALSFILIGFLSSSTYEEKGIT